MAKKPHETTPRFNADWFKERMVAEGISLRGLAKKMKKEPATLSRMFSGKQKIGAADAVTLARLLNVSAADILFNAGVDIERGAARGSSVPVVGWIDGERVAEIDLSATDESIPAPPGLPHGSVAVQVRSPNNPRDGEMLFIEAPSKSVPPEAIGRKCLVKLKSGATLVRWLKRGYRSGAFNLISDAGPATTDAQVEWATPILWVKSA